MTGKDVKQSAMRMLVRTAYMLQKTRIDIGNRIAVNFRTKLGVQPGEKIKDSEANSTLKQLKGEYKRITDGIVNRRSIPKEAEFAPLEDGQITDYAELILMAQYMQLTGEENRIFRDIENQLEHFPLWTEFLKDISGIGPAIAGLIISEIDISKAKYASSLHKYCGVDVVLVENEDGNIVGEARGRKKNHLVEQEYIDKEGNTQTKMGLSYKPVLKTKLLGVLAASFLRAGAKLNKSDSEKKSKYERVYREYKHRIQNMPAHAEKTKMHINRMATRYSVKIFLNDLYAKWRELEGLPVHPPYHEAKLGLKHKP